MTKKEGTRKTRGKRKKLESTICLYLTIIADLWSTDCAYFVLSILCIYLLLESQSHTKREGLLLSSFYGWDHWGSENLSHLPEVTQLVQKAKRESKPLQYTRREENGPGQWEKKKKGKKRCFMESWHQTKLCQVPLCLPLSVPASQEPTWGLRKFENGTWASGGKFTVCSWQRQPKCFPDTWEGTSY